MKKLMLIILIAAPSYAMGRLPSDPATYGDVQNVQQQVTANQQQEQADATKASNRLDALEGTHYGAEAVVRFYDGKHLALEEYNNFILNQQIGPTFGARVTLKLGKSYQDKVIEKQQKQIDLLMQKLDKLENK